MHSRTDTTVRLAAYASIAGAITMLVGAAFWAASGTDLWYALDHDDMAGYLSATAAAKPLLVANLSFWILGVLILGVAGSSLAHLSTDRPAPARIARVCFATAVPLAIVAFIAMLALVVRIAPDSSATGLEIAEVVGWVGARADDLATALIVGAGPFLIALAGRGAWMPNWLAGWGYLAGAVGLFSVVVPYVSALSGYSFVIVPVGLGWMLAVGGVLLRRGRSASAPASAV